MKSTGILALAAISVVSAACCGGKDASTMKKINPVQFSEVKITDDFWAPRLKNHKDVTLAVCIDQIENQTGRIRNFENAALKQGEHSGIYFDDSDVYKALEGMAYSLQNNPDPVLEAKCDEWIAKFAAAQEEDGYINTYYTLTGLDKRWTVMDKHEMYCAGHMIEAGVAYYNVTGKRTLLDVCIRMADHMMSLFGPGKRDWVPGHEEIELALVKLYQATGEKKYLDFSEWLIDERGKGLGANEGKPWNAEYHQDDKPVREMTDIAGHAVRAMYLYCGMADVAAYTGDQGYIDALGRLWDDVVLKNMYVTGGIGQSAHNEGFTEDYSLPNLTAYCETCASVGMVLWNWRMNQFTGDGKYVDVMERSMYNGALAGISLDGDRFFYVNPLESLGNHHRQAWYGCACCPSQICRFLPSIGNYIYGVSDDAIWVNLYIGDKADVRFGGKNLTLTQETRYPWEGAVKLTVGTRSAVKADMRLRIPGWCKSYVIKVNGAEVNPEVEAGYAVLPGRWKDGDVIELDMDMPVELVAADPRTKEDEGMRAVQRGPLVYCIEEVDNKDGFDELAISEDAEFTTAFQKDLLKGVVTIDAKACGKTLKYIPYYSWDNREAGKMKVWVPLAQ
ncbi:MAG: glycoside hydrolase family 127 protein [Bacteroidales bacterium]|nr:glycoside hydrolase family 127 protein [Candidatus Cryptobacteroides choladohippi]MCQ2179115.1 glycoside hydrolase family 127 protein [Bacteroidales bacterium]